MRRLLMLGCISMVGCGPLPVVLADGGLLEPDAPDTQPADAGPLDAGLTDAGPVDAGSPDAGFSDAGSFDAGPGLDAGAAPDAGPAGLVVYPFNRTQSPLTEAIAANVRRIASLGPTLNDAVFMKVGDSNTVNPNHLACFAGNNVDLDGRAAQQPTLTAFKASRVGATTPFDRVSLCATVGWSTQAALAGTPSPLEQELTATRARFATIAFGTNDIQSMNLDLYGRSMSTLIDTLLARGVVPLVSSVPPRDDSATADAQVPWYNAVARGLAQARQIPFIDVHRELLSLPNHGLTTADGLHLNVYVPSGSARGCVLTTPGLRFGHNTRNLATLEGLSRASGALASQPAPDSTAPTRTGRGVAGDPVVIDALPFVDVRDTRRDGERSIDSYPSCSTANEAGPEVVYRLEVTRPMTVRATVVSLGTADVDVHLLGSTSSAASCLARNDKTVTRQLMPGTFFFSLDTFVSSGVERAGEYVLVVMEQ
jgi:hypothetical protein